MDVATMMVDLISEQQSLDELLANTNPLDWSIATASPTWDISDQVAHLAFFDEAAALAISQPNDFAKVLAEFQHASRDSPEAVDVFTLGPLRELSPGELFAHWRTQRERFASIASTLTDKTRISWFGPDMGALSFLSARLMETWAHGFDIAEALGIERVATDRLAHVCQLGYATRKWSFINRSREAPTSNVYVSLVSPNGASWVYGDPAADQRIDGSGLDFAMVVTQRRRIDQTKLIATGDDAAQWMEIAQCFAGNPT